jgi:hypothetical protein
MTNRAVFGRQYTSYQPAGSEVWLLNGTAVSASPASVQEFVAGAPLIQGEAVYVSGTFVLPAIAASGVDPAEFNAIGLTASAAGTADPVSVVLDDIAVVSDANITADSALVPGQYYFLSKFSGQITRVSTPSGTVDAADGYAASVVIGQALSTTELKVEVEPPVILVP